MEGHGKKAAICKSESEPSSGTELARILILDLYHPELQENWCLCFKPYTLLLLFCYDSLRRLRPGLSSILNGWWLPLKALQLAWGRKFLSTPGLPVYHKFPEFTQTHVHWVGDAIQPSPPLSSPSPPAFNLPRIRVFSKESVLHIRWPKYWSFSFSISPSNEYSGLISFRIDWFDLLTVQGTRKSLLQHHSSKASILQHSAFFMAQLSHPYTTTEKTIALTIWTFVDKVMSLLFHMLAKLVIVFLPRSKCLLISWLQSLFSVILEPKKIKPVTVSIVSPSIYHEVMGTDAMILVPWMLSFFTLFFHFHQEAL